MTIPYAVFFDRVKESTDIKSQIGLAEALSINRSAITQAKKRNAVPQKWILALARKYTLSPDWLEFGIGDRGAFPGAVVAPAAVQAPVVRSGPVKTVGQDPSLLRKDPPLAPLHPEEIVMVPKASARLCAGGGSFEVDAAPVASYPFPRWWLAKKGSPADMVFMEVVGDSMEPSIFDGDTVLVDQSRIRPDSNSIFAVAVEDAIYLKRMEQNRDGLVLLSDNPDYAPIKLYGDELESVRIIGAVVWMCRDCR